MSTPISLHVFEDKPPNDAPNFDPDSFDSLDFFLFEGADIRHDEFMKKFEKLSEKHKLSDIARADMLKLFAQTLPSPNKIFADLPIHNLPIITTNSYVDSKFLIADLISQLALVASKNSSYILQSWSNNCSWEYASDVFCQGELQLVLNTDGAPVFKSSMLAVWPVWVQLYNLPPVLRSSFLNICLFGLWFGGKPDFSDFLSKLGVEIENLCSAATDLCPPLGRVTFKIRSIVCDMPATAYVLCMKQHMVYSSCPHCFIKGFHKSNRMLFKVSKTFILRENDSFKRCGDLADKTKTVVNGVKSYTPLNKFLSLPWDCPIDPMHQVFLGTAKVLSKMIVSLVKGPSALELEKTILNCKVPFEILHRPKCYLNSISGKLLILSCFFFTLDLWH